jgi:hypothetical protein
MFTSTSTLLALSAFIIPKALATIFTTSPTQSTTCHGGQICTIAWQEDTAATPPTLQEWGTASIGIWVGSQQQQTQIQLIQDGVNVLTTGSLNFTVDPTIGPNSNVYFIRFTSDTEHDPTNPTFFAESFSAKFTLDQMTGQFNTTEQAQISGATGTNAPTGVPTGVATGVPAGTGAGGAASGTTKAGTSSASKTSSTAKTSSSSAAGRGVAIGSMGVFAPLMGLFALAL